MSCNAIWAQTICAIKVNSMGTKHSHNKLMYCKYISHKDSKHKTTQKGKELYCVKINEMNLYTNFRHLKRQPFFF